jgi:hypothetical protein
VLWLASPEDKAADITKVAAPRATTALVLTPEQRLAPLPLKANCGSQQKGRPED